MENEEKEIKYFRELSKNTTIKKYLTSLYEDMFFDEYFDKYRENIEDIADEERPFLTVLIRTQGKREIGLREALLCVSAQSFTDYEIIIVGHKADEKGKNVIKDILDDQQDEFLRKIRYFELDSGTRTAPLNLGFSLSRGKYIAVFDDDDILFDDWAECFFEKSKTNDGQIFHSYAFAQNWKNVENMGYRAESRPKANYCQKFDLARQLAVNKCPLMTLAFPAKMFREYGITFDEKLDVMEDWEYFMRLAYVIGVADIETSTAIYRFWQNSESSATLHNQDEWDKAFALIQKKLSGLGLYFPKIYAENIVEEITKGYKRDIIEENTKKAYLLYSKGGPFNDLLKSSAVDTGTYPEFNYWFPLKSRSNKVAAMRFDISDEGLFLLKRIDIEVIFLNGEKKIIPFEECVHAGIKYNEDILFLFACPEIIWEFEDERYIECVHISGEISRKISKITKRDRLLAHFISLHNFKKKRKLFRKGWF